MFKSGWLLYRDHAQLSRNHVRTGCRQGVVIDVKSLHAGSYLLFCNFDFFSRKRLRMSDNKSFGNEVYRVTYEMDDLDSVPLFGAKYNFHLEGVVDCPEFLVYFPMLEK